MLLCHYERRIETHSRNIPHLLLSPRALHRNMFEFSTVVGLVLVGLLMTIQVNASRLRPIKIESVELPSTQQDSSMLFEEELQAWTRTLLMSMSMDDTSDVLFQKVIKSIGGKEALQGLVGLEMEATGETFIEFESRHTDELAETSTYQRTYTFDFIEDNLRVDEVLVPKFESFQFFQPSTFSRIMNGNIGGMEGSAVAIPPGTMSSVTVAALKRQQMLFNPHILLKKALQDPSIISMYDKNVLVFDDEAVTDCFLFIDPDTGFISKLKTKESHPLIRDTDITVHYVNWNIETEGLMFPETVKLYNVDGQKLWQETRSFVEANEVEFITDPIFDLPNGTDLDSYDAATFQYGLDSHHLQEGFFHLGFVFPANVGIGPTSELTKDVYLLPSGSNSLVIHYENDKVILLEAPGSEIHGNALIDAVNELVPGSDITHLVQSHHHVDHASGSRQILGSVNPTFVIGHGVKHFWESVLSADSDIRPDAITESDTEATFDILQVEKNGKLILVDKDNLKVTVYHTDLDPHAKDNVLTTIETNGELFLFVADLYNGGFGITLVIGGPQALFEFMRLKGLISEDCKSDVPLTIIPTHGLAQTLEESLAELESLGLDVGC